MENNKNNENEKTVMFTPIKGQAPVQNNPVYSEPQNTPTYDNPPTQNDTNYGNSVKKPAFVEMPEEVLEENYSDEYEEYDEDEKKNSNTTIVLLIIAIVAALIFLGTIIWGIFQFSGTEKEDVKDKIEIEKPEPDQKEDPISAEEEKEKEEENNTAYNIVFINNSVEREGNEYTVRAKLYNKFMVFEDERRVSLTSDTEIIEDGEELSLVSFASLIKDLKNPDATFKGKINGDTWEVINISYNSEILKVEEEETEEPEEIVEEEEITEENPSAEEDVEGAVLSEDEEV